MKTNDQAPSNKIKTLLFVAASFCLCITLIQAQSNSKPDKVLKRTLVFTFKLTTDDSIKMVDNACIELSKISAVKGFEWGVVKSGDSPKPVKHIYVFSYASEKDIEIYEKSPQHDKLVKVATPLIEGVVGFDYWSK